MKMWKKLLGISVLVLGTVGVGSLVAFYYQVETIDLNKDLDQSSLIFDRDGMLLDEVHGEEHRKLVALKDIDKDIINAVIAIEDARFYSHNGIDKKGVLRAINTNIKARGFKEGASTIEMQLIKNLNRAVDERTIGNKIKEAIQAQRLSATYSKNEILEMYLNTIYWGNNTYGIKTAVETYFGKDVKDVEIHEASVLAALIQNPSRFNIYSSNRDEAYKLLKARQKLVLEAIASKYTVCEGQEICIINWVNEQLNKPLEFSGKTTWQKSESPWVTDEAIREVLLKVPGIKSLEDIQTQGYKIYTTVSYDLQELAQKTVGAYQGWKGGAEIGLISVEPGTGYIIATVGGIDYNTNSFNRTTQAIRQPGSAMKPYVYYTAFDSGNYIKESLILDEEYCPVKATKWNKAYCPKNYGGDFQGEMTLETALAKSRNIPAVKLGMAVGNSRVISNMKNIGITSKLKDVPSFPLGSNDISPVEMATAYATFATEGYYAPYTILLKVEDKHGKVILDNTNVLPVKELSTHGTRELNDVLRTTAISGTSTAANTISNVMAIT